MTRGRSVSVVTFITMRIASGPEARPARERNAMRRGVRLNSARIGASANESLSEEVLSIIGYRAGARPEDRSPRKQDLVPRHGLRGNRQRSN